jgi:hypothetical protein
MGFSTGALAFSDFRRGLDILRKASIQYVELSALRIEELLPLLAVLHGLDLSSFKYVAVHAPSRFEPKEEPNIIRHLKQVSGRGWPIILHADAIHNIELWQSFGNLLFIENMDKRKRIGRSYIELESIFAALPSAKLCFDIGHARQVDSTMTEAYRLLKALGPRLGQVHLSEVDVNSKHDILSFASILAFRSVASLIPQRIPIILETPVTEEQIQQELEQASQALTPSQPSIKTSALRMNFPEAADG